MASRTQTRAQHLLWGAARDLGTASLLDVMRLAEQRARERGWTPFWMVPAIEALLERGELIERPDSRVTTRDWREAEEVRR